MGRACMDLADVDDVVIDRLVAGVPVTCTGAERIAAVRRLRARRWSYARIADRLGTSERQVARDLARLGLVDQLSRPRRASEAMRRREQAFPLLLQGWRNTDIARALRVSPWLISKDRQLLSRIDVGGVRVNGPMAQIEAVS